MILRGGILALAGLWLSVGAGMLPAQTTPKSEPAKTAPVTNRAARLRGFNVSHLDPVNLADARNQWGINAVRYMFPFNLKKSTLHLTQQEVWVKLMQELPAGLDAAKKNGLAVIIALPQAGILVDDPKLSAAENQARFWSDEANLKWIIDCWKEVSAICANRDQEIWFDILNEPLNRKEMPSYPHQWPSWAQKIIDEIRKTDKVHPIVVEPGPGGLCWGFKDFPRLHGEPILYSVHQYQPHAYTHQGIKDLTNTDLASAYLQTQRTWPGDFKENGGVWNKDQIVKELEPVMMFLSRNPDARIYVGEFSAVRWAPNAAQYLRENIEIFEKLGWDWTYHAYREYNGWSLEFDNQYSGVQKPTLADGLTDRGKVVLEFLQRNKSGK